jgi:hypothetical protein
MEPVDDSDQESFENQNNSLLVQDYACNPRQESRTPYTYGWANQLLSPNQQIPYRSYRLLHIGQGKMMDPSDVSACQALEVFEADYQDIQDATQREVVGLRQLGLRCIYCPPGNLSSILYLRVHQDLPYCIQILSDRHLSACTFVPPQIRHVCEVAAIRRQRDVDSRRIMSYREENQKVALFQHCNYLMESIGATNMKPPKFGVFLSDILSSQIHYQSLQATRFLMTAHDSATTPHQTGKFSSCRIIDMDSTPKATLKLADKSYKLNSFSAPRSNILPETQDLPYSQVPNFHDNPTSLTHLNYRTLNHEYHPDFYKWNSQSYETAEPIDKRITYRPQYESYVDAMSSNFQFDESAYRFHYTQDMEGNWTCMHCSHMHPRFRDLGALWESPNHSPPPDNFIYDHLSICRSYNRLSSAQNNQGGHNSQSRAKEPKVGHKYLNAETKFIMTASRENEEDKKTPLQQKFDQSHTLSFDDDATNETRQSTLMKALEVLNSSDEECFGKSEKQRQLMGSLVVEEDQALLTDYLFHLMRQLRICYFSESDRKTRGGKREKIKIGYGGLQCVHCSPVPNSRKFFWSDVDRLANSFAEIPNHILKCRQCPLAVKSALLELKKCHQCQMAQLPRGSQKIFFRRIWRRLHFDCTTSRKRYGDNESGVATRQSDNINNSQFNERKEKHISDVLPIKNSEIASNLCLIERSTDEAANLLSLPVNVSKGTRKPDRVLLGIAEDREWISDMDCFIRANVEIFCATGYDADGATDDLKHPINVGRVGIRCLHCSIAEKEFILRGTAVMYPYSINEIFDSVREFQRMHLTSCPNLPDDVKRKMDSFQGSTSLTSFLRKFYLLGAKALGLFDTSDGIRAGGERTLMDPLNASVLLGMDDLTSNKATGYEHDIENKFKSPCEHLSSTESRKRKIILHNRI